ncbi:MAG: PD-(D/E)XK nuclease domain-containing protein, partial [Rhodocyclaceae bacterium]
FFASIPHDWFRNNPIAQYEGYYASVFYAYFASLGLDIVPEESSNAGRLDMAVRFNGQVYLFEFKVVELEPEGAALAQIKQRGYADKYRDRNEPIHLIGVEFSREQRRVVGFAVESQACRAG